MGVAIVIVNHLRTVATLLAGAIILTVALLVPIEHLMLAANVMALSVFVLVDIALLRVHRRGPPMPGAFSIPHWIPYAAALLSAALLLTAMVGVGERRGDVGYLKWNLGHIANSGGERQHRPERPDEAPEKDTKREHKSKGHRPDLVLQDEGDDGRVVSLDSRLRCGRAFNETA